LCLQINKLLSLHARACKLEKCPVPKCHEIREQLRLMAQRQQSMDDRRRAMMNESYGRNATGTTAAESAAAGSKDGAVEKK
jgi:hypothetical protein